MNSEHWQHLHVINFDSTIILTVEEKKKPRIYGRRELNMAIARIHSWIPT